MIKELANRLELALHNKKKQNKKKTTKKRKPISLQLSSFDRSLK